MSPADDTSSTTATVTTTPIPPNAPPPAATLVPPDESADLPEDRYLNRELSWLDFNSRVLALAEDTSLPLLERAKFLAIFASNLDEFFMVRVAGLKRRDETGLSVRSADGLSPREQLMRIAGRTQSIADRHARVFLDSVRPALADNDIYVVSWSQLTDDQRARMVDYFQDEVFPRPHPRSRSTRLTRSPYISGLSLNLAVTVKDINESGEHFARVKVPDNVNRFIRVDQLAPYRGPDDGTHTKSAVFLPMEHLIAANLGTLFPGMEVVEHHAFRITRNADFEVEEDRDEDLLQALERELARRRFGSPVRLEVADDMSEHMLELLLRELDVNPADVIQVPGLLDLSSLFEIYDLDRPHLKDRPFVPATHPAFGERETPKSVFSTLREGDVLVHHPYDSFSTSVQRFIEQAAADPQVLAIKQTLYRTSGDSPPIVNALIDAAEAGKQVVALVEIKHASTSRPTSSGRANSSRPVSTSSMDWWGSRRTARHVWWSAARARRSSATATSVPATTTRRPRGCTRTWACSRPPPRHRRGPDGPVQHLDRVFTQEGVPQHPRCPPRASGRASSSASTARSNSSARATTALACSSRPMHWSTSR